MPGGQAEQSADGSARTPATAPSSAIFPVRHHCFRLTSGPDGVDLAKRVTRMDADERVNPGPAQEEGVTSTQGVAPKRCAARFNGDYETRSLPSATIGGGTGEHRCLSALKQ